MDLVDIRRQSKSSPPAMTRRPPIILSDYDHTEQCSDDELFVLYGLGNHANLTDGLGHGW